MENLDLLISFDDTGSMSSVRHQVRHKVNELVGNLFDTIPGLRVGIIIHNDYCDFPRHIFVMDFTTDLNKIRNFVNQDSPCGGGDAAECYELALHQATKLSWQADKRAFIVIGDEVPHNKGYRYESQVCEWDWKEELIKIEELGVQIYAVQALGRRSSNFFYDALAKKTNGVKLELAQFQHINQYINAIAYHQQGTLDDYQASDPTFSTNFALKNMFNKLRGITEEKGFSDKVELLSRFQVLEVDTEGETTIKDFVESHGAHYKRGRGFYQLVARVKDTTGKSATGTKANMEEIQASKEVIFVDKATGEAIADTEWCREQLGIPYGTKGKLYVSSIPELIAKYDIFIQSNSTTRKLDPGARFLYELDHV